MSGHGDSAQPVFFKANVNYIFLNVEIKQINYDEIS